MLADILREAEKDESSSANGLDFKKADQIVYKVSEQMRRYQAAVSSHDQKFV